MKEEIKAIILLLVVAIPVFLVYYFTEPKYKLNRNMQEFLNEAGITVPKNEYEIVWIIPFTPCNRGEDVIEMQSFFPQKHLSIVSTLSIEMVKKFHFFEGTEYDKKFVDSEDLDYFEIPIDKIIIARVRRGKVIDSEFWTCSTYGRVLDILQ